MRDDQEPNNGDVFDDDESTQSEHDDTENRGPAEDGDEEDDNLSAQSLSDTEDNSAPVEEKAAEQKKSMPADPRVRGKDARVEQRFDEKMMAKTYTNDAKE